MKQLVSVGIGCVSVVLGSLQARAGDRIFPYPDPLRIHEVQQLLPDSRYAPAPPVTNRRFWKTMASAETIEGAESIATHAITIISDEDYLHYSKTGTRRHFTNLRRKRLGDLSTLVLAECMEDQGRFLDKIGEYVASYLAMRSWTDPAHDKKLKVFRGETEGVDLFAAENAMLLSSTYSLLEERLDEDLKERMRNTIKRRIIDPYLETCRNRSLESTYSFWWLVRGNNWNAVCNAGILYTTLVMSDSTRVRAEAIACALSSLEYYLSGFTEDGYCSEGMHYWEFGFGNYMLLGEILKDYTAGKIDLFESPKVGRIAGFAADLELTADHFPAYADSKISDQPSYYSRLALARNFGVPFARNDDRKLEGLLWQVLLNNALEHPKAALKPAPRLRSWFEDAHVLVCRSAQAENSFFASIKAGHNKENHNHNDVGSYVVLLDGMFACIDPGPEYYTARTFGKERYVSGLLN